MEESGSCEKFVFETDLSDFCSLRVTGLNHGDAWPFYKDSCISQCSANLAHCTSPATLP